MLSVNDFSKPEKILQLLIKCPSITPMEGGALTLIETILNTVGFKTQRFFFSDKISSPVENLYATTENSGPHLLCCGHVDVVPPGNLSLWHHPPFEAVIEKGKLYGRGAVDMKGGISCFIAAISRLISKNDFKGKISIALTCDEEGSAINGIQKLLNHLHQSGERWDFALNAEPTNPKSIGEIIKIGRRGSLSGTLTVCGQSGHVAYPDLAINPILYLCKLIVQLKEKPFDSGNSHFQASNLEITSVDVQNETTNVIPEKATAQFNIRFNDFWSIPTLKAEIINRLNTVPTPSPKCFYQMDWLPNPGSSFITKPSAYLNCLIQAIKTVTKKEPQLSTSGGTSDSRFIKDYCPVLDFGLVSKTMHKINEHTKLKDLEILTNIYTTFFDQFFKL